MATRRGSWSRRRRWRSSAATPDSATGAPSEESRRLKERGDVFRKVLDEVLEDPEISTQLERTPGVERSDLEAQAHHEADKLWAPAIEDQEAAEALAGELERLRRRLRRPAVQAAHELVAHPYLQGAAAITGLLLVVLSFGSELLPGGEASGWSRFFFGAGASLLLLALLATVVGYQQTRRGGRGVLVTPPLLLVLTGCGMAALGIVQANRLVQFRTEAWVVLAAILVVDAAIIGVAIFRRATASRAQPPSGTRRATEGAGYWSTWAS